MDVPPGVHRIKISRTAGRSVPSSMQKKPATAYWLIPAEPEHELFRTIIRILAKQFDAPRFEPHLTLLATRQDRQPLAKLLRAIKASPIRLKIRGVASSPRFTKTLFVRFVPNKSFDDLVFDLTRVTRSRAKSVRDSHVSLLYKKMSILTKRELAAAIKLPIREVTFNSIRAVRCISPTTTRRDVEAWRVITTKTLSG
jgi:cyclic phosphodiesterase-like protein